MGEPIFKKGQRYVDSKGHKFGKGVWYDTDGKVIKPGQGIPIKDNKQVVQYNTDGTKTVFTREQWHHKKTLDHETKVLQNDRRWAIPFIPEKEMTVTIDKDSPTRRNHGARFSENVLDSIAVNADRAGIPFSTGLALASTESTIGSSKNRSAGISYLPWLRVLNSDNAQYKQDAKGISYKGNYSPTLLISNWKQALDENPFAAYEYNSKGELRTSPRTEKYYKEDFRPSVLKSNREPFDNESPLQYGFEAYKKNPYNYNHGDPHYPDKVEANRKELTQYSPEIKAYMQKHNLHSEGGYMDNTWDSLSQKEKAEMMKVAIANGITTLPEIKQAYNKFAKGGKMNGWTMQDEAGYRYWRQNLPKNLRETDDNIYDMRAAYKAGMQPQWSDEDKSYHLGSRDPESGRILKSPHHPTFLKALVEDAKLGYYPTMDNNGNVYTETWEGNKYAEGGNLYRKGGRKGAVVNDNSQRAMNYLLSKGMSKTGAAAIVGTLQAESGLDPTVHAKMKGDSGEGLAQWTGSRKKNFWKTLETIEPGAQKRYGSIDRVPLERQLDVVLAERPGITNVIHTAKDIGTATDIMLRGYENGGGTVGSMASRKQMNNIYGKWNNDYNTQINKRLSNANNLLGTHYNPNNYVLPDTFFGDIESQIANIPQLKLPEDMDTDPELRYKAPTIDMTLFQQPKETAAVESMYNPQQERLEGMRNFNTVLGLMGQQSPFAVLSSGSAGLLDYISQIYS